MSTPLEEALLAYRAAQAEVRAVADDPRTGGTPILEGQLKVAQAKAQSALTDLFLIAFQDLAASTKALNEASLRHAEEAQKFQAGIAVESQKIQGRMAAATEMMAEATRSIAATGEAMRMLATESSAGHNDMVRATTSIKKATVAYAFVAGAGLLLQGYSTYTIAHQPPPVFAPVVQAAPAPSPNIIISAPPQAPMSAPVINVYIDDKPTKVRK